MFLGSQIAILDPLQFGEISAKLSSRLGRAARLVKLTLEEPHGME